LQKAKEFSNATAAQLQDYCLFKDGTKKSAIRSYHINDPIAVRKVVEGICKHIGLKNIDHLDLLPYRVVSRQ
jgi:hypothetical protein